jgi:hypothetical protein
MKTLTIINISKKLIIYKLYLSLKEINYSYEERVCNLIFEYIDWDLKKYIE